MKKRAKRPAPQKLRAIQTSRHLHVVPHQHTGHLLPRRTTSYPTLTMLVLCVGVFLLSWTRLVTADQSYTVHASVPGVPPAVPATISSPTGGNFTATPIVVTGSCPLDTYVGLFRNNFSSGVALCNANGNYSLSIDLFKGTNHLVAYDYSFSDRQGPPSNSVTVYYERSFAATGSFANTPYNPSSPSSASLPEPLLLKSNFTFLGYYIGQPASWKIDVEGGTAPYAVSAQWGDGKQQLYSQAQAGSLNLQHVYAATGGYRGSYVVKITATDAAGDQAYLQLLAIVSPRPKTVVQSSGNNQSSSGSTNLFSSLSPERLVDYTWSGYCVVLLMLFSFWLGERREFHHLRDRLKRPRHA